MILADAVVKDFFFFCAKNLAEYAFLHFSHVFLILSKSIY